MGIDVNNAKVVTLNPAHENRVATDPQQAIATAKYGPLDVISLFRRRRTKHDNDDGNPLIYALKGIRGYTIAISDVRRLVTNAREILPRALIGQTYDIVVPLPSSSPVSIILAKRVAANYPVIECLDKATVAEVLAAAPAPNAVKERDRSYFTSQLARMQDAPGNDVIQMKSVMLRIRQYFDPLSSNVLVSECVDRNVLLVDDIVGSGTSLISAQKALLAAGATSVSALTLLSRL